MPTRADYRAKEIILVNDLTLELKAVMKSRGVVADSDDEDDDAVQGGDRTAELELEMVANQTWHVAIGGTLDHANSDLAEDPFMQLPDQGEYEKMTAKITEANGALPIPVMTTLGRLPRDDVLVHWSERPTSRGREEDPPCCRRDTDNHGGKPATPTTWRRWMRATSLRRTRSGPRTAMPIRTPSRKRRGRSGTC